MRILKFWNKIVIIKTFITENSTTIPTQSTNKLVKRYWKYYFGKIIKNIYIGISLCFLVQNNFSITTSNFIMSFNFILSLISILYVKNERNVIVACIIKLTSQAKRERPKSEGKQMPPMQLCPNLGHHYGCRCYHD